MAHQGWNAQRVTAILPNYRHPLDGDAPDTLTETVTVSRETWYNARAILRMFEARQILTYRQRVDRLPEDDSLIIYLKSRTAMGLRQEAEEADFLLLSKIEVTGEKRGDVHEFTTQALGIKPFEWKPLYS